MHDKDQGWFDRPGNVRLLIRLLVAVCVLLVVGEMVATWGFHWHKHTHFGFEEIPGFHAIFGFVVFAIAVYAGKLLRALLSRNEDYYDR